MSLFKIENIDDDNNNNGYNDDNDNGDVYRCACHFEWANQPHISIMPEHRYSHICPLHWCLFDKAKHRISAADSVSQSKTIRIEL